MTPYLTDTEIAEICEPLVAPSAQHRFLKKLGLIVNRKPNGKPLVARGEFERVLVGRAAEPAQNVSPGRQPNMGALIQMFSGGKHAKKAKG